MYDSAIVAIAPSAVRSGHRVVHRQPLPADSGPPRPHRRRRRLAEELEHHVDDVAAVMPQQVVGPAPASAGPADVFAPSRQPARDDVARCQPPCPHGLACCAERLPVPKGVADHERPPCRGPPSTRPPLPRGAARAGSRPARAFRLRAPSRPGSAWTWLGRRDDDGLDAVGFDRPRGVRHDPVDPVVAAANSRGLDLASARRRRSRRAPGGAQRDGMHVGDGAVARGSRRRSRRRSVPGIGAPPYCRVLLPQDQRILQLRPPSRRRSAASRRKRPMKITDVTVQLVQSDDGRKWTHVRVHTDEVDGIGEATYSMKETVVAEMVRALKEHVIGRDPSRSRDLPRSLRARPDRVPDRWGDVHERHQRHRPGALWDLKGKLLGVPVSALLGGPREARVPVYSHFHGATCGGADRGRPAAHRRGLHGVKSNLTDVGRAGTAGHARGAAADRQEYAAAAARARRRHRHHGRPACRLRRPDGSRVARVLEPYRPLFLRGADDPRGPRRATRGSGRAPLPTIAGSERLTSKFAFHKLSRRARSTSPSPTSSTSAASPR